MKTNQTFAILFWIYKSREHNGKAPIYCRITIDGKRSQFSLNRKIEPGAWIKERERAKGKTEEIQSLNNYLDYVKAEILKRYNILLSKGEYVSADTLKNSYLGISEKKKTLFEAFTYHNETMKECIGIDVVKATHTKFETVFKKLKLFVKTRHNRTDIPLELLNHQFVTEFEYFLKVNQKIGHNTTMKYIQTLKKIINMAVANDWLDKNPFSKFKCTHKNVVREVLTKAELQILADKKFSIQRLEEVRDIFLFCCYTGYAFIDVEKLTPGNLMRGIDGKLWIYTSRQKTGVAENVPLLIPALEIIKKYENHPCNVSKGKLLPVKSNQKMNAYLKEIADVCGINKTLTMHIARHTFATTVTLSNGVPIETVSKLLGHTRLATTQIYAKVVQTKVSADMDHLNSKLFPTSDETQENQSV